MRTLLKVFSTFLVVILLIAGGAFGYLWYTANQKVDRLILMAKPFVDINYDSIDISPAGSVGVNRVRIKPYTADDTITIGSVRLGASNFLELLLLELRLKQNRLPENFTLSLQQIHLPIDGGILNPPPEELKKRTLLDDLDALGCGSITHFGSEVLSEMGYSEFISNVTFGYHYNADKKQLNLQIDSSTRDWMTLNLDVGFMLPNASNLPLQMAVLQPEIAELNAVLHDDGFNERRNQYCATKSGKAVDAYIVDHLRQLFGRLQAIGITPGAGLIQAYQRFMRDGGQVTLTVQPDAPIAANELAGYSPKDMIELLRLSLTVNQTPINDLSFSLDNQRLAKFMNTEPDEVESDVIEDKKPKFVVIEKKFHPTSINELSQYTGKHAKIITKNGAKYTAQLGQVVDDKIAIIVRKSGGQFTWTIPLDDIASVQVLY